MQQQSADTCAVHDLFTSVSAFLVNMIDPANFAMIVPVLYSFVPTHIEGAISHVVASLAGKIPDDVLVELVRQITVCLNTNKYINNSIYNQISYFLTVFFIFQSRQTVTGSNSDMHGSGDYRTVGDDGDARYDGYDDEASGEKEAGGEEEDDDDEDDG